MQRRKLSLLKPVEIKSQLLSYLFEALVAAQRAMILLSFYGALRFGRPGTTYVSVVTPPLAFAANALFWIMIFDGFRPSRVGIDFIAALASVAPFLIIGAAYGWFVYLNAKAKTKPSKARRD